MASDFSFELSPIRCRVHPAVVLTMLDAHGRWVPTGEQFAIGTLLGTVTSQGKGGVGRRQRAVTVDIVDCFVNNFHWDAQHQDLSIAKDYHEAMLRLKERHAPRLQVLGWCITNDTQSYITALSDWARSDVKGSHFVPLKQFPEAVILSIDPTFEKHLSVLKATQALVRGPLEHLFHQVPLEFAVPDPDAAAISAIIKASAAVLDDGAEDADRSGPRAPPSSLQTSQPTLVQSLRDLRTLVEQCRGYVDKVLSGEIAGNPTVGRELLRTVCVESAAARSKQDQLSEAAVQDTLSVAYLVNIANGQVGAAEDLAWTAVQAQQAHHGVV